MVSKDTNGKRRIRVLADHPTLNVQDDTGQWFHFLGGQSYEMPDHIAERACGEGWGADASDIGPAGPVSKSNRKRSTKE